MEIAVRPVNGMRWEESFGLSGGQAIPSKYARGGAPGGGRRTSDSNRAASEAAPAASGGRARERVREADVLLSPAPRARAGGGPQGYIRNEFGGFFTS